MDEEHFLSKNRRKRREEKDSKEDPSESASQKKLKVRKHSDKIEKSEEAIENVPPPPQVAPTQILTRSSELGRIRS
jgi:hypothetical protein